MTKIFLLINNEANNQIENILSEKNFELMEAQGEFDDILTQIHHFSPDIILIENSIENCEFIVRQIKSIAKNQNTQIIFILNNNIKTDFLNLADGLVELPLKDDVLLSVINSHSKIKKSLDRLYENNKELSKSLYQLNVLYNTSSQFAGTLNTSKLYEIMIEAMEKTLSFDISSVLIFNQFSKPILYLNTIHTPSENLIDALKIRSILNYKTIFEDSILPHDKDFEEIETIQKTKQSRSNKIYSIDTLSYDSLFAPIKVGDDFFGVVELFRQTPYSTEDVTCFQAITHQVALPLRSAKLYEEISSTNKKLEKLEKIKSEFVSIVSHELRTPLTPINNSLEIVLSGQAGEITPEAKNFISMAKRNIQRLSGIIEDLLDLSRMQTGKLDLKYKLVDITPSLELLQKTFQQVAQEKNIKINLEIKQKLPEIYADIRRIEQILSNLVSNSLKFTPQDGIIDVSAEIILSNEINKDKLIAPCIDLKGAYIKISVKDNGIGIKQEDIPKIFDKFSQIETSLNRNKGGVGLGLTITKQLIDSHLGAIWVESEEKKGSIFNVILPLNDEFKTFEMDLSHTLVACENVGILKINFNKRIDLIELLKDQKLLNPTKSSKEILLDKDERKEYWIYIPKISLGSFDAIYRTIEDFCTKISSTNSDIILSKAHSEKDGIEVNKIINILNN